MATSLHLLRLDGGFTVHLTRHIRDDNNNDLPLLDILGPKQSVRATWARLKSRQTHNWELGGTCKLLKDPGHITIKNEMPNGWVNWSIVSRQAIPRLLNPSIPTYCWKEPEEIDTPSNIPPTNFFPIFMATMPFPTLPEWSEHLWNEGLHKSVIQRMADTTGVTGFRIIPMPKTWKQIISEGFRQDIINLGIPVSKTPAESVIGEMGTGMTRSNGTPAPQESSSLFTDADIIHTYTRKEALADGFQVDANIGDIAEVTHQHYKWPVYMSRAVWDLMVKSVESDKTWTDYKGIWHDILHMSRVMFRELSDREREWEAIIVDENGDHIEHQFHSESGPTDFDDPAPCVYIKLSSE